MADADDSYDFAQLDAFVDGLRAGNTMVIGHRFRGGIQPGAMPLLHRYLGNPVLSFAGRLFFSADIGDFHCGLRGVDRAATLKLGLRAPGMEFASEMIVKATLAGWCIVEVPTVLSPDGRSRAPHLRSSPRDGWRHLRFLLMMSPRWLMLYPGACLIGVGVAAEIAILHGPVVIGGVGFDIHSMLYAGGATILGVQLNIVCALGSDCWRIKGSLTYLAAARALPACFHSRARHFIRFGARSFRFGARNLLGPKAGHMHASRPRSGDDDASGDSVSYFDACGRRNCFRVVLARSDRRAHTQRGRFMSAAENLVAPGRPDVPVTTTSLATIPRVPVYVACTLAALITNYLLGKDMAWDTLNYHLYAGFSALNDRFAQDYFAAGPPSYFNPYAFVPFYILVKAGLSPLAISSLLAIVHSIIFWLVYELAICVCPSYDRRVQMMFGVCAIAMTFLNPILVQQIGSSFADITTAELMLGGWLLLAQGVRAPHAARMVCAGLLIGCATALKPTNAVHAVAACTLLIFLPKAIFGRIRYVLSYAAALALGFTVVAAPWSYRLEQTFGNPLFPLMNGWFRSPEFTAEPLRHFRFIPASFVEALWRPFAIVNPVAMVQEELTAPDLRYAVLAVLASMLLASWLGKHLANASASTKPAEPAAANRALAALGCGFATDWALWLSASGNGRYFLPMASVAAILIVALIFRLFAARPKLRNYVLVVILSAQIVQIYYGADHRWNADAAPWDRKWLSIEMPEKLSTEPNLYLTTGVQSNSFIAAYLAKDSGLVNFSGAYVLGSNGAAGARIEALMHRYAPRLRVLWRATQSEATNLPRGLPVPGQ